MYALAGEHPERHRDVPGVFDRSLAASAVEWSWLDDPGVADSLDGRVADWLADVGARRTHGHRQAAAMKLTEMLGEAVLGSALDARYLAGWVPDIGPQNVALGWSDGELSVALARPRIAVAASSDTEDSPDAVVVADLDRWLAEHAAASLTPVLSAVRRRSRVGLVTLWGRIADTVHARLLRAAKDLGHDTHEAWRCADRITAALGSTVPRLKLRPRPFPVEGTDREGGSWSGTWLVFGTCCYLYKAEPEAQYCNVCPLRSDGGRRFDWMHERPPAPMVGAPSEAIGRHGTACPVSAP